MKSVKILVAMLALSVAGASTAATPTASRTTQHGGTATLTTSATGQVFSCESGSTCTPSANGALSGSITNNGLGIVYYCLTTTKKSTSYAAPSSVGLSYDVNNATCTIGTLAGNSQSQGQVGSTTPGPTSSGSAVFLNCSAPSSTPVKISTTSINCSKTASAGNPTTATATYNNTNLSF